MEPFPIHCNKCYAQRAIETNLDYYISTCGHVVCSTCVNSTCPLCSRAVDSFTINSKLPSNIKDYFEHPLYLHRVFQKVTKWQYSQERRLVEHLMTRNEQAEKRAKAEQQKYKKILDSLQRKLDQEKERLQNYKECIARYERWQKSQPHLPLVALQSKLNLPSAGFASVTEMRCPPAGEINVSSNWSSTRTVKPRVLAPPSTSLSTIAANSISTTNGSIAEIVRQIPASIYMAKRRP